MLSLRLDDQAEAIAKRKPVSPHMGETGSFFDSSLVGRSYCLVFDSGER